MMTTTMERTQDQVELDSTRFGRITIAEESVISFVQGMPGFDRLKQFILIDHDQDGVFKWLQSTEDPEVAFLLTDPTAYRPGYTVPLRKVETERLNLKDPSTAVILVTVCVSPESKEVSLNLKGPLVFNSDNMTALQCVIDRDDYPASFVIKC